MIPNFGMQLPILQTTAVRHTIFKPLRHQRLLSTSSLLHSATPSSTSSSNSSSSVAQSPQDQQKNAKQQQHSHKKTMAELDEELRQKLEGLSGEGGASGIELEDGKPVAMKRGVRENMFRLI